MTVLSNDPFNNDPFNPQLPAIDYENSLNPAQLEAVMFDEGPLLVIAGAGSGKTRTLTYRVARMVEEGIPPAAILLLTFTRKAAMEMLKRATRLLDERCGLVSGGTFHSFANLTLRKYASYVGFTPGFAIMDRGDAEALISLLRKEIATGPAKRAFPRKQTLANIFSRAVNKVLSVEDILYDDFPHFIPMLDDILALHEGYKQRKVEHNFFDYDDLLIFLHRLLKDNPEVRASISAKYSYIMVDEYQDTNLLQAEIVALLANERQNVMVVGDDSQSIYAFRGAHFKNIMKFPELFPGTKMIRLEENYRSVQPILTLTNTIIQQAREKYTKKLFSNRKGGQLPVLIRARSENSQSRFVVGKIQELHRQGMAYNEIAVLFRSGFHSFDLEIELSRNEIPFIKVGGFKFVESAHIKDVLAHFRVLANPKDRVSWYRILLLLNHIGAKTAGSIYQAVMNEKDDCAGLAKIKMAPRWRPQASRLAELFTTINAETWAMPAIGDAVMNYYAPILQDTYDDHPKRLKDLEHLMPILERYDTLERFLSDMALEPPNTSMDDSFAAEETKGDRLVLSTIHSAKGLEWHSVFIISALQGRFPSMHALHDEDAIEEERRLMYVAATRAKDKLYFIYPTDIYDRSSGRILYEPSDFIDDIPAEMLLRETAARSDW